MWEEGLIWFVLSLLLKSRIPMVMKCVCAGKIWVSYWLIDLLGRTAVYVTRCFFVFLSHPYDLSMLSVTSWTYPTWIFTNTGTYHGLFTLFLCHLSLPSFSVTGVIIIQLQHWISQKQKNLFLNLSFMNLLNYLSHSCGLATNYNESIYIPAWILVQVLVETATCQVFSVV